MNAINAAPATTATGAAPSDRQSSAADRAYRDLRALIVSGELRPGEVITEEDLVARLGIGRSPVREAVQRLARQHVMTVFPRRGLAIASLGLEEIQSVFDAREAVEGKIAELAALRRTESEGRQLRALAKSLRRAEGSGDSEHFLDVDQELHHLLATAAKSAFLAESADVLLMLSDWVWHQYFRLHGADASVFFGHEEIIEAVLERDATRARAAMEAHIRRSRDVVRGAV